LTAHGNPRAIFRRAIVRGNLAVAETTMRQMGQIELAEALELTALIALKDPRRRSRFAARWLQRLLEEHASVTIEEAALAAAALAALGGPGHDNAASVLVSVCKRATGQRDVAVSRQQRR
jgi:hypothetical protein